MLKYADIRQSDALIVQNGVVFDRWIVGVGPDTDNECVVHLSEPRFVARFTDDPAAELPDGDLSIDVDGIVFGPILWLDADPGLSDEEMLNLFRLASVAITRYSFGEE